MTAQLKEHAMVSSKIDSDLYASSSLFFAVAMLFPFSWILALHCLHVSKSSFSNAHSWYRIVSYDA